MNNSDFDNNVSLYKLFYSVCKYSSFSKTAEMLGVTQPTISYGIKKLEEHLGVKLFERGNTLRMTPEAEALFPYVEAAINSLKKGESKINELANLKRGYITIGVPSHIGVFLLTDIIKKFNQEYSNIKIKVICKSTKELFKLLYTNELDVVIDCSPLEENIFNFMIIKICEEKCGLFCNKKHKELLQEKISVDEVLKYPLIVPAKTSGSTKALMEVFAKNNLNFDPLFEIATSDMIAEMVLKNLGIGYLFEKTKRTYPDLVKIDMDLELPTFDVFIIFKQNLLSNATKIFIDFVINNTKKQV